MQTSEVVIKHLPGTNWVTFESVHQTDSHEAALDLYTELGGFDGGVDVASPFFSDNSGVWRTRVTASPELLDLRFSRVVG